LVEMRAVIFLIVAVVFFVGCASGDCPNQCSNRGFCKIDGNNSTCSCVNGFFGDDCSKTIWKIRPDLWYLYQTVLGAINVFWVLGYGIGFLLAPRVDNITNVTKLTLGVFAILGFTATLHYCVDPYGIKFYPLNFVWICVIEGIRFPTALVIFMTIAFHWLELYIETIERLDQVEMIRRIKENYNKEVTIDDILGTVKNIRRLRTPCIIITIFFFVFRLAGVILKGLLLPAWVQMNIAFNVVFIIACFAVGCVSFYFGRKLYKLYPKPIDSRMKRITNHVFALGVYQTLLLIAGLVQSQAAKYDENNITSWYAADFVFSLFLTTCGAWVFFLFAVPVWRRFFLIVRAKTSSSGSTYKTPPRSDGNSLTD